MAVNEGRASALAEKNAAVALEAAPEPNAMEGHPAWPMISRLPVMLSVGIPLTGFRVCDLLALESGQTILSNWIATEEVPLKVGERQLSWGEFEVVDETMALRLTRLT
jgi:flagellar motor switch/type III secretory pathway protein FliN